MIVQLQKLLTGPGGKLQIDVNFELSNGAFVTLYGENGVGKSSILRMLAGFLQPDRGTIEFENEIWFSSEQNLQVKSQNRRVGFVFQDYALFPNMTVRQNLKFSLPEGERESAVDELLEVIAMQDLQHNKPATLSGGQKQRVGIARALIRKPELLLLDEPFSALDKKYRSTLQDYILQVHKKQQLTTILVSHEAADIFKLSDEILLVEDGKIVQRSTPSRFYSSQELSGKFKFTGEIVSIEKADVIFIVSVIIGSNLVKIVADETEVSKFSIGDTVLVASKAFNPIIQKLHDR